MPYNPLVSTYPDINRTRLQLADDTRVNILALRDGLVMGRISGWTLAVTNGTGTAELPQIRTWSNGTERIRATFTWTGARVDSILWEYSPDAFTSTFTIDTQTMTYSATHMTASTHAGLFAWLFEWIAKFIGHRDATGTSVHGLGSMSTQAASAVAVTGGTAQGIALTSSSINSCTVGTTTPAEGRFTRATEQFNTSSGSGAQNLDWTKGGSEWTSLSATTFTFTNLPPATVIGTHIAKVAHFDAVTWPAAVTWGSGGKPTVGTNKGALVGLTTYDAGATVYGTVIYKQA